MFTGLGWSLPLRGSVLAQQLLHLGQIHGTVPDANVAKQLAGLVPQLYRLISDLQNPDEFQMASALLNGTACVWVGNGFASAGKVSFKVGAIYHHGLVTAAHPRHLFKATAVLLTPTGTFDKTSLSPSVAAVVMTVVCSLSGTCE